MNPFLKSGSFAAPDFSAFLRQDSRHSHVCVCVRVCSIKET